MSLHESDLPPQKGETLSRNNHYYVVVKSLYDNLLKDYYIVRSTFVISWPTPTGADRPANKSTLMNNVGLDKCRITLNFLTISSLIVSPSREKRLKSVAKGS